MDDLAAFLKARLDEDEAAAKRAASDPVGAMEAHFEYEALKEERDGSGEYSRGQADALRWSSVRMRERMKPLVLHDPARLLREVAAGRAFMRYVEDLGGAGPLVQPGLWILRNLAGVYSDHPGYRAEWKP